MKRKKQERQKEQPRSQARGQMEGQVLMFLLAVIIFGMVVIYGYRAVTSIGETREQTALIEFKNRIQSQVEQLALDYGSVKRVTFTLPSGYQEVCFIDNDGLTHPSGAGNTRFITLGNEKPLIYESIRGGSTQNIFLIPLTDTPLVVEDITIPDNPATLEDDAYWFCIPNRGTLALRLEGLGDRVAVGPWVDEA